jgi:general secretion pathway protein D
VVVQVEVLEARTDRLRDLGILPGQTATVAINPNTTTGTSGSTNNINLNTLRHLNATDYVVTLPSLTANAVLSDTNTKIIQNPEVRSLDGQTAKLRIGDRIPIATGSFSSGIGGIGGVAGGVAGGISPLVNTQFTYLDVGVNIDLTPRVHPNRDVSLKLKVEVSSHTGDSVIGGITQPIISQRVIEHDIRLKEGEVSILGGLVQRTDSKALEGWPGLARLPLLRYLFSHDRINHQEDEVLIVLTPRIVRIPEWTKANLRPMYSGSETNVQVKRETEVRAPAQQVQTNQNMGAPTPAPGTTAPGAGTVQGTAAAKIHFDPQSLSLKAGQTATIGVVVENVNDLFSIPLLLQYNPAVISVEEVQHGGFLSGGTQEIAIVQQVFKEKGQAIISATRQPNTPGVSGSGTLIGIVVKALAPGSSNLSIVQVNAKDSQQKLIPLVTSEATLQVQP